VLGEMLKFADVQCVAVADVQAVKRAEGKGFVDGHYGNTDCRAYGDMRELLARPDIDCVLIATGDRWHGKAAMMAAEAGKDVYCEKPCGLTIDVCRRIAETMRRTGRIFQAGTQRRSVPNFIKVKDLVQAGRIGGLQEMHASVYVPSLNNDWLPAQPTPPVEECDWNVWLGPAPWRPYNKDYLGRGWRGVYDFEAGARLLDWGVHTVDLCQWVKRADDTAPVEFIPADTHITCRYADGVTLTLEFLAEPFKDRGPQFNTKLGTCPVRFVGSEGALETGDAGGIDAPAALEGELPESVKRVAGTDASAHARNFFDCVKSRTPAVCNADVMRRSHVVAHAAANAWILGRTLGFDPATETFTSGGKPDAEANGLRSRPERDPWA
ncbi:MAG: gfo/Idh/MocA family oxidoreductase, partial [Planctomycetia bacterium]|nr:gfo/Idh/MocA family oxidoreductase [Planctomycetia bacterium]